MRAGYNPEVDIDDGDVLHPNFSHTVTNNKTVGIAVEIVEDDVECFPICGMGTYGTAPSWTSGSDSQRDWATATHTVSKDTLPDASGMWNDLMWSAPSPVEFAVAYQVGVTVTRARCRFAPR